MRKLGSQIPIWMVLFSPLWFLVYLFRDEFPTSYVSHFCDRSNSRRKGLLGSYFERTVCHGRDSMALRASIAMVAEIRGSWSQCIYSRKQRDKCWCSALFLIFLYSGAPAPGKVFCPYSEGLPSPGKPVWKHPHRHPSAESPRWLLMQSSWQWRSAITAFFTAPSSSFHSSPFSIHCPI